MHAISIKTPCSKTHIVRLSLRWNFNRTNAIYIMETMNFLKQSMRLVALMKPSPTLLPSLNLSFISRRNFSSSENQTTTSTDEPTELEKKLQGEVETLTGQVDKLTEKNDEILDKYRRSLADGENLRIRLTKQIQDAKVFGIQSFCRDLLEVADTLGHATNAVPKEEVVKNPHLKNLYDGLVLTQNSLSQVFKRHGLEQINPMKEKFNPNFHEALFQKECSDVEPNTVVIVTKIGYKLHDRCIRPALVGVSTK